MFIMISTAFPVLIPRALSLIVEQSDGECEIIWIGAEQGSQDQGVCRYLSTITSTIHVDITD